MGLVVDEKCWMKWESSKVFWNWKGSFHAVDEFVNEFSKFTNASTRIWWICNSIMSHIIDKREWNLNAHEQETTILSFPFSPSQHCLRIVVAQHDDEQIYRSTQHKMEGMLQINRRKQWQSFLLHCFFSLVSILSTFCATNKQIFIAAQQKIERDGNEKASFARRERIGHLRIHSGSDCVDCWRYMDVVQSLTKTWCCIEGFCHHSHCLKSVRQNLTKFPLFSRVAPHTI